MNEEKDIRWMLLLIFVLLIPKSYSYIESVEYKGFQLRFYDENINKTRCIEFLDSINESHLEKMSSISFFDSKWQRVYGGMYWSGGIIYNMNGCNKEILTHELGHHLQWLRRDSWMELLYHKGHFYEYMEEVRGDSDYYYG